MSVLDRDALEESPLADLHAIASELSIDGYRRLRREQLIDTILERQEGATSEDDEPREQDEVVEGEVEVLPNGSGFVRMRPPEASEDDIYITAAQVRRCELISGDRIAGPRRPPRRSERFASLYRVDTINGRPAAEQADRPHFDELPAAFPSERFEFDSYDPTLEAIERLTPIGKGSRVTITGPARAGKSEALRRLAEALARRDGLHVFVVLAGVRPEEIADWDQLQPSHSVSFAAPSELQEQAVVSVIDQARRVATRGGDAVVLIDTLDGVHLHAARRALAAARNLRDGASLTVIATSSEPIGGETTVVALDPARTATGTFPALDLLASGTVRPELLVGEDGAYQIARARSHQ